MFARVANSKDPMLRNEARLLRARALRETGRPQDGLAMLEGVTGPKARSERLLGLAGAQQRGAALALADSMLATKDSTGTWDTLLVSVGRTDPLTASALVDRLERKPETSPAARARLLFDDGMRLAGVDSTKSEARMRQASSLDSVGDAGERARLRLTRLKISRATSVAELPPLAEELDARVARKGTVAGEAGQLRESIGHILTANDSASAGAVQADLRLFLAAESARDSLAAPALAATLFRTIVEVIPESPYAPKAILAGQALDPVWGASAIPLLEQRYAASPYVSMLRGEEPYGYRELEDSLQSFSLSGGVPAARRPDADPGFVAHTRRLDTAPTARTRAVRATESSLSRTVFGRRFQNPVLLAAGTAGFGRELDGVMDLERLGGLVTKAVSVQPRKGNPPPRVAEFPGGMLNSVGLANPGLQAVRGARPALAGAGTSRKHRCW